MHILFNDAIVDLIVRVHEIATSLFPYTDLRSTDDDSRQSIWILRKSIILTRANALCMVKVAIHDVSDWQTICICIGTSTHISLDIRYVGL